MEKPRSFASFIGNPQVVDVVRRALRRERLPHALIFAGPSGVGKNSFALLLAQRLNCQSPAGDEACASCNSCRKILAGSHPDVLQISPDGTFIKIEQIRALVTETAFQPFEGKYRVAILDAADQMRSEAANSLLKTLEEPASRTFIFLVTTNPYALLTTIRSRSRLLHFGPIPQARIEEFLVTRAGRPNADAAWTASFCNGSLGAALAFDTERFRELRELALRFVRVLLSHAGFTEASRIAAQFQKDKEGFPVWLDCADALLAEVYYGQIAPHRMTQRDLTEEIRSLASTVPRARVLNGIAGLKNLRRGILRNANRLIGVESLYLENVRAE